MGADKLTKVLIADDHAVTRSGMSQLIRELVPWSLVIEAGTYAEVLEKTEGPHGFGLVLLDMKMPGASQETSIASVVERMGEIPVVVMSAFDSPSDIRFALASGAKGFIPKSMSVSAMLHALGIVLQGEVFVPSSFLAERQDQTLGELSPRESEVLAHLCEGQPSKEIARVLGLSEPTVKTHLANIYRKMGVSNRAQAVSMALRMGLQ
jgi:two-component system nitrate/nitrite response regulator NarL